jgi:hypothetical protein
MQTLTESVYRLNPPGGLFDDSVVRNLFPKATTGARKLLLHRAVRKKEVLRLKGGLYCLAEPYRRSHPHPFVVATLLHSPSHISLESALSYHGLIPEAVLVVTSVTVRRSNVFHTPLGSFSFQRVPASDPRAGVHAIKVDGGGWAFIASPLRAIADTVYLRREVTWENDGLRFLTSSMRIEETDLDEMSLEDFEEVYHSIRSGRTRAYLAGLKEEIGR